MLLKVAIAALMFVITTAIHAGGMMWVVNQVNASGGALKNRVGDRRILRISGIVIAMFLVSLLEVVAWVVPYLAFHAITGFEKAVYFSMVTFTTLGYGDVILDDDWRLLASFEAANGIIMFGWTTAIVMSAIRQIFFNDPSDGHGDGAGTQH